MISFQPDDQYSLSGCEYASTERRITQQSASHGNQQSPTSENEQLLVWTDSRYARICTHAAESNPLAQSAATASPQCTYQIAKPEFLSAKQRVLWRCQAPGRYSYQLQGLTHELGQTIFTHTTWGSRWATRGGPLTVAKTRCVNDHSWDTAQSRLVSFIECLQARNNSTAAEALLADNLFTGYHRVPRGLDCAGIPNRPSAGTRSQLPNFPLPRQSKMGAIVLSRELARISCCAVSMAMQQCTMACLTAS